MRDKKDCENQVANYLSRLESPSFIAKEKDISDKFPDETMMRVATIATPWYEDFANYIECGIVLDFLTPTKGGSVCMM